eukprot:jgi/Chlat1/700/Chrsp104S01284
MDLCSGLTATLNIAIKGVLELAADPPLGAHGLAVCEDEAMKCLCGRDFCAGDEELAADDDLLHRPVLTSVRKLYMHHYLMAAAWLPSFHS